MSRTSKNATSTASTSQYYDNRSVVDAAGGIVGSGNAWDQSLHLTDASSTTNVVTDGRSFDLVRDIGLAQADTARAIALGGSTMGTDALELGFAAQARAVDSATHTSNSAFDLARSSQANAFESSGEALGFARETFGDVLGLARTVVGQAGTQADTAASTAAAAYSSATDSSSGNKTLIYAGVAAVAAIGLAAALRN